MPIAVTNIFLKPVNIVFLLFAWAVWLYWSTLSPLQETWAMTLDTPYSHGFFMLGLAIVIFVQQWRSLGHKIILKLSLWGVLLVFLVSFLWLLAKLGHVQIVQLLSFLMLLGSILYSLLGWKSASFFLVPLLLLLLVMPIFGEVGNLLQIGTALAVDTLLNSTGLPAFLDGFLITIPAGVFEIAPGCSGVNQFVVGVTLAVLMSWFNRMVPVAWVINIVCIALIAFAANILRVYIIIWMGQKTAMQHYFITVEHVSLGWVLFMAGFFAYLFVTNRLFPDRFYNYLSPQRKALLQQIKEPVSKKKSDKFVLPLLFIAVAIGPAVFAYADIQSKSHTFDAIEFEALSSDWSEVTADANESWQPVIQQGDVVFSKVYRAGDNQKIALHLSFFAQQAQGKEAVSDDNKVYDGKQWKIFSQKKSRVVLSQEIYLDVEESLIKSLNGKEKIVWRWYYVQDQRLINPYVAKVLNIVGVLLGRPEITVFVVATDQNMVYEESIDRLKKFLVDNLALYESTINGMKNVKENSQ
ncbi:MAG: EpsI family protein [Gammaproteobacteria bacterium]|nr:EpsI family protein [Gammaproteobacteria bacterium]